jgi:hypothetical protein
MSTAPSAVSGVTMAVNRPWRSILVRGIPENPCTEPTVDVLAN